VYGEADGLPSLFIASLLTDSAGTWIGTDRGLARLERGRIRVVSHPSMPAEMAVMVMKRDTRGRLWLGLRAGGVVIWDGREAVRLGAAQGLTDQTVWSLSPDVDGAMWLGTNGDGAFRVAGDSIRRLGTAQGLANDFVWQVLRDSHGGVWLYTSRGLDHFDRNTVRHYARGDGLLDLEGAATAVWEDVNGDLWFGSGTGVTRFVPRRAVAPVMPPTVYIERLQADGRELDVRDARIRPGSRSLQLDFAAPSFRDESAVRFRYRLLGTDTTWSEPTAETTIRYAGLAPGTYTFEVIALVSGMESAEPARVTFTVLPAFWQRPLFQLLAAALLLAAVAAAPVLRNRHLEAERRRLTALVAQHTGALEERNAQLEREIAEREAAQRAHARIEEQLRHGQKLEAVGRLAGGIAHDFNNLLTSVVGHVDLMAEELGERHPARTDLGEIRRAADRAASLVSQLLAFSRQQPMRRMVLDLNAIVTESTRMLQRMLGTDVTLRVELDPELAHIRCDRSQIDQILVNLALNARDAMPDGGTLVITTANVELDEPLGEGNVDETLAGPCVLLRVADSGHGMDDAVRSRVFEPFFTTKAVGKGTGLGLSTVYGIVKQNDGQISVESRPGHGSVFSIYLPRVEDAMIEAPPADSGPMRLTGAHGETVLVVEDERAVRRLVCRALAASGYRVLEAAEGAEALDLADRHEGPIHLLLSDMIMPGLSGKDVADAMRLRRPDTPVLFMSGHTRDVLGSRGMLDQATALMQKPFGPTELLRRVREVIDGGPDTADEVRSAA
jgi:signal transduction histidine kinase